MRGDMNPATALQSIHRELPDVISRTGQRTAISGRFNFRVGRQPITSEALNDYYARLLYYPLAARRQRADIYHITDDRYGAVVRWLDPRRCVVSVNHGTPEIFRDELGVGTGVLFRVQRYVFNAIRQAAYILTASRVMRDHILEHYPLAPERVVVNPYGYDACYGPGTDAQRAEARAHYGWPAERFVLLHVGNMGPTKNIETLLRALPLLPERVHFVQAGGAWAPAHQRLIAEHALGGRVQALGRVPELTPLYHGADAFVFPSLMEGFGLPLLEAMAAGLPAVTSNFGTMAEVAGQGALTVDPRDPAALAAAVRGLLDEPGQRQHWRAAGLRRSQDFSWRRHAETLRDLYLAVDAQNRR